MIYHNTKTGAIIDSPCTLSGGDWVIADEQPLDPAETPHETAEDEVDEAAELKSMTIDELKVYAAELAIDLGKVTKKDDIIKVILESDIEHEE